MQIYGRSDLGCVRHNNEDAIAFDSAAGVAVLADGMGGLHAGEVASRIAVDEALTGLLAGRDLGQVVESANRRVYLSSLHSPRPGGAQGMGTTLVALQLTPQRATVANVGDSRIYRFVGGALSQLTHDHSMVQQYVDSGEMTAEEARQSPNRNIITRAVGLEASVQVDVASYPRRADELYVLCSDGLTDMLAPEDFVALCRAHAAEPATLLDLLIDGANAAGGLDNVSVIVVQPHST